MVDVGKDPVDITLESFSVRSIADKDVGDHWYALRTIRMIESYIRKAINKSHP